MNAKLKTILLVEDDIITAKIQVYKLMRDGFSVVIASTAENAFNVIESQDYKFHLILMDIDLGGELNGIQAAEVILSQYGIPVLFLTSNTDIEIIRKAESVSPYGYILKNMSHAVLVNAIAVAIDLNKTL